MIDKDGGGTLSTDEIVTAVKEDKVAHAASYDRAPFNLRGLRGTAVFVCLVCGGAGSSNDRFTLRFHSQEVINFLINCGNKNLQYLLVPNRLQAALAAMDTDHDGHIDLCEWEACIEIALQNKLEQRAAAREAQSKAALKEIAEFTGEFLSAAQRCFELIDKDGGGTLSA